ncbi:MAG: DUF5103 domain-containing protein [Lentimicrobiaceae bacterium]|nr:DUF5103 domain-containing protein [Lentimicrobiaceae bacterium]
MQKIKFIYVFFTVVLVLIAGRNLQAQPRNYDNIRMENAVYHEDIASVKLEKRAVNFSLPVISLNSGEQLTLTVCDVGNGTKNLYYTFIHCTHDWQPTTSLNPNEYMDMFMEDYISDYETSVNTIQFYTAYTLDFPNDNMRISKSGNYILYVYDGDEPVLTQRFYVVEQLTPITPLVQQSSNVSTRYTEQEVSFQLGTARFRVNDPSRNLKVVVMQNGRTDNAYVAQKPAVVRGESISYGLPNEIRFEAGNEFRIFNIRTLRTAMENVARHTRTEDMNHTVLEIDKAKSYNAYEEVTDINGCYFVANDDRNYSSLMGADFSMVYFSFMGNLPADIDVYVYGELTNWTLQPDAKLTYNQYKKVWETALYLRTGYYNYIYIAVPKNGGTGSTFYTEGNFWQTENRYTFFAYYQGDGIYYDRIIGYAQCFSFAREK